MSGPDGKNWIYYKFYQHVQGGDRKGNVLFFGQVAGTEDYSGLMRDLIVQIAGSDSDFAKKHGAKLLAEDEKRVSWKPSDIKNINTSLEASYSMRGTEHRFSLGLLEGLGSTQAEAKRDLIEAVGSHISYPVQVRRTEQNFYVLYPHGKRFKARVNDGPEITIPADSLGSAEAALEDLIQHTEGGKPEPVSPAASTVPPRPRRPSIRANP
jgi:hypothetical protein